MDKQSNPCSLYLSLLPENEIKNVYISDSDEEGFRQYLTEQVQKFDDSSCAIPDIWLVQINFENRRKVERATSKIEGIIRSELEQQKGKIMHVISLMDAYYCYLKHINPLLEENKYANIVKTEGYFLLMISSKTQYMHEHSLMGIRTDRGVHVFSPDRKGMKAMMLAFIIMKNIFSVVNMLRTGLKSFISRRSEKCRLPAAIFSEKTTIWRQRHCIFPRTISAMTNRWWKLQPQNSICIRRCRTTPYSARRTGLTP